MKVNSTWKGVGGGKITQRKTCFVLSLKRQKSIQTQQQSHHRLTVPQSGETREEFSEINISLVFVFSSKLLLLISLIIWPRPWKETFWQQKIRPLKWLWTLATQGLANRDSGLPLADSSSQRPCATISEATLTLSGYQGATELQSSGGKEFPFTW